jgi:alcohol dehydrogenase class IV
MAKRRISYPVYRQPAQVTFGTGSVRTLAEPDFVDDTVFLLSGHAAVRDSLRLAFERQGRVFEDRPALAKPPGEPTVDSVRAGAAWLSQQAPRRIVAVGGGSVLDWARLSMAVAGGWLDPSTGTMTPPMTSWKRPELTLVPSTCGSGAEASAVAVYVIDGRKQPVVSSVFIADRVILDGQFLSGFDGRTIAPFLCDALSHSIESFVSIVPNALAKQAAASALPMILEHRQVIDPCHRDRLMEAGYLAGVAASNCSVGVVHAFAHALAVMAVPHGVGNAIGLCAGIATNAGTHEMQTLLARTGFRTADALAEAVTPIVSSAMSGGHAARVRSALDDPEQRQVVLDAMTADVCLRSNPRRLERGDLAAFLDQVVADLDAV